MALNGVPGLGSVQIARLREFFGSAVAVCEKGYAELVACGLVSPQTAQNIYHFSRDKFLSDEYNLGQRLGVEIITAAQEIFPAQLRDIPGAPVVLYVKGEAAALNAAGVGMVGSRVCSYYGQKTAKDFAAFFARAGLSVISGMARGIDTAAHRGALDAGGKTIAVLGCGLKNIYPRENQELMEQIIRHGAVVSEFPLNTPPLKVNFPQRNRIISGLGAAVVIIEAAEKSGALITTDFALEQGRDVFAVPANVDYETAKGSNRLLKDGAKVALAPSDVLEELHDRLEFIFPAEAAAPEGPRVSLSEEQMLYFQLIKTEPVHLDQLAGQADRPVQDMAMALLDLELKGLVRQLPGKFYVRM